MSKKQIEKDHLIFLYTGSEINIWHWSRFTLVAFARFSGGGLPLQSGVDAGLPHLYFTFIEWRL